VLSVVLVLLEIVLLSVVDQLSELVLVLLVHVDNSERGGGLLVDDLAETSLALHNDVRDAHLAAQSRQPQNEFNGIDIVGDYDELGALALNQSGDVVDAELDNHWGLASIDLVTGLSGSLGGGSSLQTGSLVLLRLRLVLSQELEERGG
jgi:hypothetical protein